MPAGLPPEMAKYFQPPQSLAQFEPGAEPTTPATGLLPKMWAKDKRELEVSLPEVSASEASVSAVPAEETSAEAESAEAMSAEAETAEEKSGEVKARGVNTPAGEATSPSEADAPAPVAPSTAAPAVPEPVPAAQVLEVQAMATQAMAAQVLAAQTAAANTAAAPVVPTLEEPRARKGMRQRSDAESWARGLAVITGCLGLLALITTVGTFMMDLPADRLLANWIGTACAAVAAHRAREAISEETDERRYWLNGGRWLLAAVVIFFGAPALLSALSG